MLFILLSSKDTMNIGSKYICFVLQQDFFLSFMHRRPWTKCSQCTTSLIFIPEESRTGSKRKQMGGNDRSAVDAKYRIQVNTLQDSMQWKKDDEKKQRKTWTHSVLYKGLWLTLRVQSKLIVLLHSAGSRYNKWDILLLILRCEIDGTVEEVCFGKATL